MVASLETLDNIRDRLINNGLGTSALGSQSIQRQGFADLGRAINTSAQVRQGQQATRMSEIIRQLSDHAFRGAGGGNPVSQYKPFVLGKNKGDSNYPGGTAVAIKDQRTGHYAISTMDDDAPIVQEAANNKVLPYVPNINKIYASTLKSPQYNPNQVLEALGSKDTNLQGNTLQDIISKLLG